MVVVRGVAVTWTGWRMSVLDCAKEIEGACCFLRENC